jgi:hypothetical protein
MQRRQRFVADQRWDLPQYKSMLNLIEDEFQAYNVHFLSDKNYIVKNWLVENNGGLQVRVGNAVDSLLFNFERAGKEGINLRETGADLLTLDLADNSVNYVEVQMVSETCAPDTVAIWDTVANSGQGQEFTQTVDTVDEQKPVLVANTVAFTGDGDKVPLAIVTTSGGVITDITDARNFFFHLDADWDFGVSRTDKTISSIKEAYDAVTTAIKEMKGLPNWYDAPGPSFLDLLERMNYILNGGGTIFWEQFNADELQWSADLKICVPSQAFEYVIPASTITNFLNGEVLYVTLPDEGVAPTGPLTVQKTSSDTYQIDNVNTRNYIFAYRASSKIYFGNSWTNVELESGEGNQLGDGITEAWIKATGLTDENDDTPAYTSTFFVTYGDSFIKAISDLDNALNTIAGLVTGPVYQESVIVPGGGYSAGTQITLPSAQTYNVNYNSLEVYIDGKFKFPGATEDYLEINDGGGIGTKIELLYPLPADTKITFRIQIGGSSTGVSTPMDIYDETTLIESSVIEMRFVGAGVTASSVGAGQVQISVPGTSAAQVVKYYKNETGVPIPAGKALAFLDNGTITLADANIPSVSDFAGITQSEIPHNAFGPVVKLGNVPGILSGLGATPGDFIYLGETPGELQATAPIAVTDTIITVGRAEPPDGVATSSADDLFISPEVISAP